MKIEELNISAGAKKMLQAMNIETVNQLLEADIVSIKALFTTHPRYQAYFDEIFEAIKDLDLHFNYEYNSYYPYINSKNEDLEQIKISSLDLTPDLRKYLEKYDVKVYLIDDDTSDKDLKEIDNLIKQGKITKIFTYEEDKTTANIQNIINKYPNVVSLVSFKHMNLLTEEARKSNSDYVTLMNQNLDTLKEELYHGTQSE